MLHDYRACELLGGGLFVAGSKPGELYCHAWMQNEMRRVVPYNHDAAYGDPSIRMHMYPNVKCLIHLDGCGEERAGGTLATAFVVFAVLIATQDL
jgi:hypothetical protein